MAKQRLTAEDIRVWREAMGEDVAPLPPPTPAPAPRPLPTPKRARPAPSPGPLAEQDAKAIRRGRITIEARVDLHGLTQAKAHATLSRFLKRSAAQGIRCVLVITGKGGARPDPDAPYAGFGTGVLRTALPKWLEAPGLAPFVIGSAPAMPRDGGEGARYVLLRRRAR